MSFGWDKSYSNTCYCLCDFEMQRRIQYTSRLKDFYVVFHLENLGEKMHENFTISDKWIEGD